MARCVLMAVTQAHAALWTGSASCHSRIPQPRMATQSISCHPRSVQPCMVTQSSERRVRWLLDGEFGPSVAAWAERRAPAIAPFVDEESRRVQLNLVVVSVVISAALFCVLFQDAPISRGWTWWEKMGRLLTANWQAYEANLHATPMATKTAINAGIYCVAEWLSQVLAGAKPLEFDLTKVLKNGGIGMLFGPLVCLYYGWSDEILPPLDAANIPYKILMDQTIYAAVKYSAFLGLVGLSAGRSPSQCVEAVRTKLWPTLTSGWKFWPAVHLLTYGVVPPAHRILWINCVDLLWVTILASIGRQGEEPATPR